jgi:hypothetical protein
MKLEDARTAYQEFSAKASEIVRQISLAGVGLIWIFKSGTGTTLSLNRPLLKAALFICLSLLFDFLQYVLGTTIWFAYFRHKEKQGTKEGAEFLAPPHLNWPTWSLFYLKSAMILIAYGCYIIPFLASMFRA